MITFTILIITMLSLIIAAALIIGAGGVGFILAFADVIICAAIIWFIVKVIIGLGK